MSQVGVRRRLLTLLAGGTAAIAAAGAGTGVVGAAAAAAPGVAASVAVHPLVNDALKIKSGETPPTQLQCQAVGRTCFTPQAIQSAYNLGPLYGDGFDGSGYTIAVVDSYGSDTMAHDLAVFDTQFGVRPLCGQEGYVCKPGDPWFRSLSIQGSPATKAQPGNGTHQEDKSAWALEVALDVETSHAIAPGANILLVHTPTAETLGVQGLPQMMMAESYVIQHGLADVISQSFGTAEGAFGSAQSLLNLRYAYQQAQAAGVTVLASSGDSGSSGSKKTPVGKGGTALPTPEVGWPASDPLVTAVGGTYLCTDPTATTSQPRTLYNGPVAKCDANPTQTEVGWTFSGGGFSHIFARPDYQNSFESAGTGAAGPGSTPILDPNNGNAAMRGVPDVAFQASAGTGALVYLTLPPDGNASNVGDAGWYDIGGTSLSCPQWAGIVAIADQYAGHRLGFINPALYQIGANATEWASDFYDVTTGNNTDALDAPGVPGYPATFGWDPVTGLGTPNAAELVPDLVAAVG